jgi:hypothetical protein
MREHSDLSQSLAGDPERNCCDDVSAVIQPRRLEFAMISRRKREF